MDNDRMKALTELLNKASEAYYNRNAQIISDFEYDKLYDELVALEAETGVVLPDSPTRRVGYEVAGGLEKVRHESRLLSLDKTKEPSKLVGFLGEAEGILSWKLDGLTIVLKYRGSALVQAVTRGNGEIGEDITHNARVFGNIPQKIEYGGELVVRGEAIIHYTDFGRVNSLLGEGESYKNPRNLTSGTVRQLNSRIVAERNVRFYAFTIISADGVDFGDSKLNQLSWLGKMGFSVTEHRLVTSKNVEEAVEEFRSKVAGNDFASDGLVLTYDSISRSRALGATAKFPRDSIAFKWADELAETNLKYVSWNTSRTGLINPVAVFEPVELEGTTVNRASLHNLSVFESFELGEGDIITVYKANMIIPQVAENLSRSGGIKRPETCGVCGHLAEVVAQSEGRALYCVNPNCRARLVNMLTHFTSRDGMNIEGLSEETLEKFIDANFLESYADIYELSKHESEIAAMKGFGVKSCKKIMDSIESSKDVLLPNFIYALGIKHIGLTSAKILDRMYNGDIEAIMNAAYDDLVSEKHIGDAIAKSLIAYFSDKVNVGLIRKALGSIRIAHTPYEDTSDKPLSGMSFVVTGDVTKFANRKELQAFIERHGGRAGSSVSKNTTYLINNNIDSGSSKNKTAKSLNVPIIDEEGFMKLLEEKLNIS